MTGAEFQSAIDASPDICEKCEKRECSCWRGLGTAHLVAAQSSKAFGVAMRSAFRPVYDRLWQEIVKR